MPLNIIYTRVWLGCPDLSTNALTLLKAPSLLLFSLLFRSVTNSLETAKIGPVFHQEVIILQTTLDPNSYIAVLSMEIVLKFLHDRIVELDAGKNLLITSAQTGTLPVLSNIPQNVFITSVAAFMLTAAMLAPKPRKLVFDVVETIIATALLLLLVALLLGLPLGQLISLSFLCSSYLHLHIAYTQ